MSRSILPCLSVAIFMSASSAAAGDLSGRIDTIGPILGTQNQIYISMTGTAGGAIPNGSPSGSCSSAWAYADMTNEYFKSYVYPLILMAKSAEASITLRTSGCFGAYPVIVGVDYSPRP